MSAALDVGGGEIDAGNQGATIWISELTWRDFYAHVMVGFPRVSKHIPFKKTARPDIRSLMQGCGS